MAYSLPLTLSVMMEMMWTDRKKYNSGRRMTMKHSLSIHLHSISHSEYFTVRITEVS